MAGRTLKVRRSIRFAAVVAVVIALHAWVLQWLGNALEMAPPMMRPMTTPLFTRLLHPEAPPPMPATPAQTARKRGSLAAVRRPVAKAAAKPASMPAPVAPASAPEVAASTPEDNTETSETTSSAEKAADHELPSAPAPAASATAAAPASTASGPASASVDFWPVDTSVSYRLSGWYRGELTGSARVQWLRQQESYEVSVTLDLGIFSMKFLSQGGVGEMLSPRAYQESRPGRTRVVQLGPENVVLNDGRTVGKPAGVQDSASQFVELAHRFSTGREKLVIGGHTNVWIARPGGVDLWTYDIVGLDALRTPQLGTVDAFHLKPRAIADARGDIYVEIWLAPSLQYLPVRIRIHQGAESWVDILVERIEQR